MSYFDDASLVMIPSGYKTSKVYSVKPTDGTGDLTFTRSNSTATRVGPVDGLIEKVRTNQVLQSQTFDNASWVKYNSSVTANSTTAPDGTSTADTLVDNTANDIHVTYQSIALSAGEHTISCYAKANTLSHLSIYIFDGTNFLSSGIFNLSNGTASGAGSIVSAGNGWYRVSFTTTIGSGSGNVYIALSNGSTISYVGSGQSIYIWGYQVETGVATDYIATTSAAVSVGPVANVPRLDYLNSSCPRLLLEPTATALNQFSEQLDNAYWTGSAVVTANTTISPDGYQNADTLNDNTTTFLDKRRAITVTPNVAHTFSFFVKKTSGALTHYAGIAALLTGGTTRVDYGIINTTTGAINRDASSNINSVSYSSVSYGDYWRVIMTFTDNQSNTTCTIIAYPAISTNGTSINQNAQGSNVFWGLNLTQSSYATSYIPTLGAAVTRGADAASKTGISSLIGQTEGTLFLDFVPQSKDFQILYQVRTTGSTNVGQIDIRYQSSNLRALGADGGVSQFNITAGNIVVGQRYKCAVRYQLNNVAFYVNGSLAGTDLSSTFASSAKEQVSFNENLSSFLPQALVNQALLFPTALSDAQLAELTA